MSGPRRITSDRLRALVAAVSFPTDTEDDARAALDLVPDDTLLALADRYPRALVHLARHAPWNAGRR